MTDMKVGTMALPGETTMKKLTRLLALAMWGAMAAVTPASAELNLTLDGPTVEPMTSPPRERSDSRHCSAV